MIINVSSLRESRYNALIRLSKIQRHQIIDNNLDYQVESYINLKQLIQPNVINKFSLGQLSIIVFNIVVHLIKVYQKIYISQLTFENIIFNQELKVKFINLQDEDNLQTYQQNLQIIINLIQQLFLKYQELLIEQYNDQKQISICKKIELGTFYSNKILTLLQSKRHLKKLKLFVTNQVENGIIKDNLFDDNLTEEREFRNIFLNSLLSNNSQRNSNQAQQFKHTQQQNRGQSKLSEQSQQGQTTIFNQQSNVIEESQPLQYNQLQYTNVIEESSSVQYNQYKQSNVIEESQSLQYNQYKQSNIIEESQSLQNNQLQQQEQFNSQQLQMSDYLQQQPENHVPLQPYISQQDQNNVSQISQLKGKAINPDLYAFYVQNIAQINNDDFKANLLGLFSKIYKELNEQQAGYICQMAFNYFTQLGQFCQELLNLNKIGQDQINQFYFMGLDLLIQLCYDERLLELELQTGFNLCQEKLNQFYINSFGQQQLVQEQQENKY